MNILIIGSMAFAKDMVKVQKELEKLGHKAKVPYGIEPHLTDDAFVDALEENKNFCIENDVMRKCFQMVSAADAVLVLNHTRNNIPGYIGASALMELGIAHFFKKKIFLYHPLPDFTKVRWAQEVAIMQPIIISADMKKIR